MVRLNLNRIITTAFSLAFSDLNYKVYQNFTGKTRNNNFWNFRASKDNEDVEEEEGTTIEK